MSKKLFQLNNLEHEAQITNSDCRIVSATTNNMNVWFKVSQKNPKLDFRRNNGKKLKIQFFDWSIFQSKPDNFADF